MIHIHFTKDLFSLQANCDWEGLMSRSEFIAVAIELLRDSCNGMDDVRAAFRVFDHNNDGTISKEELQDAMLNFGTRVTEEWVSLIASYHDINSHFLNTTETKTQIFREFQTMFAEADQNNDGLIGKSL